jgi:hypothetical protein
MVASARHLLVEIEAYYLPPRSGESGGVPTERQIPGYFPVTCFVSRFRSGKFPGSTDVNEFIKSLEKIDLLAV